LSAPGSTCTVLSGDSIASRSFQVSGGCGEHFLLIRAPASLGFEEQLGFVCERYRDLKKTLHLDPATAISRRIFLSDISNQVSLVNSSDLVDETTAVSLIQQPPLPNSKIQMLAYHTDGQALMKKRRLSSRHLLVERRGQRHLWSTRLCARAVQGASSAAFQTQKVFADLIGVLATEGATLSDNCVRTWIYVRDIDNSYQAMVDSRRAIFSEQRLTSATHYIASTGIEGVCAHAHDLIAMDAYSNLDLVRGQMSYLNDFDKLCRTADYNVTFERGTRIAYGDRAHYFISGTASIDHLGQVLYPGNVIRQLERALDNIDALLKSASATLADMMYLIVYLRDPSDCSCVEAYLCNNLPFLPIVIVQGAVCRPSWLVEVEGVAITKNYDEALPRF
jgi:enamine deaminase RidA (YjgF/YER057c/UK114 family)